MRNVRLFLGALSILLLVSLAWIFAARAGLLTPAESTLRARYALADSQFLTLDGEVVHYVDRGRGPALVLLHGSAGSLRMWDDWDQALTGQFRVIRFDRPRMGLSGPAPAGMDDTERELQVIKALTRYLRAESFFVVGTSSAGVAAAAYAASHPTQIRGVVLSNIAVGSFKSAATQRSLALRAMLAIDPWLGGWRPAALWQQVLLANFHDPGKVPPGLAREWADLNNRAQRMPPATMLSSPMAKFDRTVEDLPRITAPTLLLWSDHDHELPVETMGRRGFALSGAADKQLEVVSHCGHMLPLECGVESAAIARGFFVRIAAQNP